MHYNNNVITRATYTIQIIEDVAIYKAELFSTAGNIFQPSDTQTELSIKVFKGLDDITENFTDIKWKRFSFNSGDYIEDKSWGDIFDGLKTITVTKQDVNDKCKIQCEVYDVIKGEHKLVAVDSITIIDVNDMQPSDKPPSNPIHGQIWIDSSVNPPVIKMWDEYRQQWITIGTADPIVRNNIRNSNFYTKNLNLWNKENLSSFWEVRRFPDNNFLRLKQETIVNDYKGISQTILNIKESSNYTLQCLARNYSNIESENTGMRLTVISYDSNDLKTLLKEEIIELDNNMLAIKHIKFETMPDTKKLEVFITGRCNQKFDFIVSNIMLANTNMLTPWELAPEDIMDAINNKFNHEDIFNALTDDGKIQGIFTNKDNEGNTNFYFNASYIKTGELKGELVNTKNLVAKRDLDDVETLRVDSDGNIILRPKTFELVSGAVSNVPTKEEMGKELDRIEEEILYKVDIDTSHGTVFTNGQIYTKLIAKVFKGRKEVTDELDASSFVWTKVDSNGNLDEEWNSDINNIGVKEVLITHEDVYLRAVFKCDIIINN